jgi:predicted Zn-dependent peptidase
MRADPRAGGWGLSGPGPVRIDSGPLRADRDTIGAAVRAAGGTIAIEIAAAAGATAARVPIESRPTEARREAHERLDVPARAKPPQGGFLITAGAAEGPYQRSVLPNGLVVVTEPMAHVRTVSLGVWIDAGSRYEDLHSMGVSHFIEHALFKGTATRSALAIAQEMDALGGHLNAFTDREHTCFYLRVLSDHLEGALAILADMVLHPALEPAAVERERQVILEEIASYEDAPDDLVHDVFAAALWPGHPLGWPVAGSASSVGGLSPADLRGFMEARYRPGVALVAAAGQLEHGDVVDRIRRALGAWNGAARPVTLTAPAAQRAVAFRDKDIEQVHLCLGAPSLPQAHPDRYVMAVLEQALGGGMSSRLFQEIREERGLAYSITAYHAPYRDTGAFVVYAGTAPEACLDVVRLAAAILGEARRGLPADDIARAKESLKGGLMLDLETPGSRMSKLARSEQYFGRQFTLDEILADVDHVRDADVRRVAETVLAPAALTLAAVGPFDHYPQLRRSLEEAVRDGHA